MMNHDIYLRAYTVRLDEKKPRNTASPPDDPKWSNYALVFDCETRITADQTLTLGFWRFCELRSGVFVPLEEGIFHDDVLGAKEMGVLRKYKTATKPETADDGSVVHPSELDTRGRV